MLYFTFFFSIVNPSPGDRTPPIDFFAEAFVGSALSRVEEPEPGVWLQSPFGFDPPFFFSLFAPAPPLVDPLGVSPDGTLGLGRPFEPPLDGPSDRPPDGPP